MNRFVKNGFTMLELMITIVVLGILATLAMVNLSTYLAQKKLETSAYNIQALMTKAKTLAYKTERTHFLVFDKTTDPTKISIYADKNGDNSFQTTDSLVESYNIKEDMDGTALSTQVMLSNGIVASSGVIPIDKNIMTYKINNATETIKVVSTKIDTATAGYMILLKKNEPKIHFLIKSGSSYNEL